MLLTRVERLYPAARLFVLAATCAALATVIGACADNPTTVRRDAASTTQPHFSVTPDLGSPFGLVLHAVQDPVVVSDLMNAAEGSGARWARVTFYRSALDPNSQGTVTATGTAYRATVDSLTARGIQVYGTIEYPQSASDASNPAAINTWRSFVQQLDQAFPAVHYWAIGNEANVNAPYNDPVTYDVYLGAAADAVPGKVTIGEPSVVPTVEYTNWISSRLNVLKQRGITPGMIPVHRYFDHRSAFSEQLHDLQNASGAAGGVPIWLTEFGLNGADDWQNGQYPYDRAARDSITVSLIAEVYRALVERHGDGASYAALGGTSAGRSHAYEAVPRGAERGRAGRASAPH